MTGVQTCALPICSTASTIAASKTLTFDVNGEGSFVISDAVDLVVNDGSVLAFTGDMDVTIGASEATSLQMLTATTGDGGDFDASGLSGDLILHIQDTTAVDDDEADILLGTGESTVTIYGGGTSGARVVDDGFFIFKFDTDGIANTNITGLLSTTGTGENNDVLSFAGYEFGTADEIVSISGTKSVVENGDDEQILQITDVGSSLEITSLTGAFDGVITLSDHTSVADLTIANFDF